MTTHARFQTGLQEALERLRQRLADFEAGDPLVSLDEVLAHLYSLDQYHANRLKDAYWNQRKASPDGQTEAGLIYARGLIPHGQAEVARLVTFTRKQNVHVLGRRGGVLGRRGGSFHYSRGASTSTELSWRPFDDLPRPNPGHPQHDKDVSYRQYVEGKPVMPTVEAAVRFMTSLDELAPRNGVEGE